MLEKGIYIRKEIYDSIEFPFEYGELITCICFIIIIILRFKVCHRQEESWKLRGWQGSMNNSIWISFTNSGSIQGKGLCVSPGRNWSKCQDFLICLHFSKTFFSWTRTELDFLFHFWLLPSYSWSRYSLPFPCILLCWSLSWVLLFHKNTERQWKMLSEELWS